MKKKSTILFQNIKRTWVYAKYEKKNLIIYVSVALMECIISAILPLISATIIINITSGIFEKLILIALTVVGIQFVYNIFGYFKGYFFQGIYRRTLTRLQMAIAEETLNLEVKEIDKASSGIFIDRLNKDTKEISEVFMNISYYLSELISAAGVMVAIFFLNKYLFIFSVVSVSSLFYINKLRIKKQYEINKRVRKLDEKTTGLTSELVRGIRDIKVLNANDSVLEQTSNRIGDTAKEEIKMLNTRRNYMFYYWCARDISDFLFLLLGSILCMNNLLDIAVFVILYTYQNRIKDLLNGATELSEYIKKYNVAAERVYEVISDDVFAKETFGTKHLGKAKGNIEFKNVSFAYNDKTEIIKNMSFAVGMNETVAFVGRSGAGKTTLFSLITKLYTVNKGNIYLDNIDINELDRASIRDNMSIITQNPYIFNFSVKENLLLANANATMKELRKCCKIACIDDFIMSLPDGYDTMVGEGGLSLSGGQRQRLAIARALLMKTEIILFDEATSALDNETQSEIQQAIHNMKGEYTILIIAHRLSTVIDSDKIFVIDDGTVVDSGSHKELLKSCKIYQNLYDKDLQGNL